MYTACVAGEKNFIGGHGLVLKEKLKVACACVFCMCWCGCEGFWGLEVCIFLCARVYCIFYEFERRLYHWCFQELSDCFYWLTGTCKQCVFMEESWKQTKRATHTVLFTVYAHRRPAEKRRTMTMLLNVVGYQRVHKQNEKWHYWKHSTITHQHIPACLQPTGLSPNQDSAPHAIESDTGD